MAKTKHRRQHKQALSYFRERLDAANREAMRGMPREVGKGMYDVTDCEPPYPEDDTAFVGDCDPVEVQVSKDGVDAMEVVPDPDENSAPGKYQFIDVNYSMLEERILSRKTGKSIDDWNARCASHVKILSDPDISPEDRRRYKEEHFMDLYGGPGAILQEATGHSLTMEEAAKVVDSYMRQAQPVKNFFIQQAAAERMFQGKDVTITIPRDSPEARDILQGEFHPHMSMGCIVPDTCSICGNREMSSANICEHLGRVKVSASPGQPPRCPQQALDP